LGLELVFLYSEHISIKIIKMQKRGNHAVRGVRSTDGVVFPFQLKPALLGLDSG